jgi:hypothetical protein
MVIDLIMTTYQRSSGPSCSPKGDLLGFMMGKMTHFGFPCQFLFHRMLHTYLPLWAGTMGPLVACLQSVFSPIPIPQIKKSLWSLNGVYTLCSNIVCVYCM